MKRNDKHAVSIPIVISACCILHNMCEIHCEMFNETWLLHEMEYEHQMPHHHIHTMVHSQKYRRLFVTP